MSAASYTLVITVSNYQKLRYLYMLGGPVGRAPWPTVWKHHTAALSLELRLLGEHPIVTTCHAVSERLTPTSG